MSEWQLASLGEMANIKGGKRLPKGKMLSNIPNSHPYIRTTDITNHTVAVNQLLFVPDEVFPSIKRYIVESGDVIISIVGTIGLCAVIPECLHLASLTENCAKIVNIDEDKLNRIFLYYYLVSEDGQAEIESRNVGSTQPKLPLYNIQGIPILLPPLEDQKSIASVLSRLDGKIDLLHRQNKTLEAMAETLFRQWFVEGAGEDCPITDYLEFNPPRKLSKGAVAPYLEMAALSTTAFNPDGWYDREFSSGMKFINGDTLLARITPCLENGKTAYVTFLNENQVGWGSTEYIVMRPVEMLHPLFAYVLARNQVFREYAEGCMAGSSGRQRVDIEHLKLFQICKPTKDAVDTFNQMAKSVEPKLHANMVQIKTLEKLRDSLLPKLMSGEIRVDYAQ